MKKFLLVLALSTTSMMAAAELQEVGHEWAASEYGLDISVSYARPGANFLAAITVHEGRVAFHIENHGESKCTAVDSALPQNMKNTVLAFNGQMVNMESECTGPRAMITYPKTSTGNQYIIDQFIASNRVRMGGLAWSAKGFTKEYHRMSDRANAL